MTTPAQYRVISIGTLAANPLWDERAEVRTGHATTTLITTPSAQILIDPSLPSVALAARLEERSGLKSDAITHVFLTSADPLHARGLGMFTEAKWLVHEPELEAARASIAGRLELAGGDADGELDALRAHRAALERCRAAPDAIVAGVDLFPLPGVTPGSCGVLLPLPRATVCITGDAVATIEHLERGQVLPGCHDVEQAQESLGEAVQIADLIVPGRDNLVVNPLRPPFGM